MKWSRLGATLAAAIVMALVMPGMSAEAAVKHMYWTDVGLHKILRANADGTGIEEVLSTGYFYSPLGLQLDVSLGKLYWTQEWYDSGICRANLDGSSQEDVVGDVAHASAIALDAANGKIYWIGWSEYGIWRANTDGSGKEKLSSYPVVSSGGMGIDPAGGKLYFTSWGWDAGWAGRANLDGSGVEVLVRNLGQPSGMALDLTHGKMYWVSRRYGTIQRANLNGSSLESLVTGLGTPGEVAVDVSAGMVYWTDFGTKKIQRASMDGTGIVDLVTGLALPAAIALEEIPTRSVTIDIRPGSQTNPINLRSRGVIPVAILSSPDLDAPGLVDQASLTFGRSGDEPCLASCAEVAEDVNGDGLSDLLCQFRTRWTGLLIGDTQAILKGHLLDGQEFRGVDSIKPITSIRPPAPEPTP